MHVHAMTTSHIRNVIAYFDPSKVDEARSHWRQLQQIGPYEFLDVTAYNQRPTRVPAGCFDPRIQIVMKAELRRRGA